MLTDTRIIARQSAAAGALEVLAQRHEVMFRDGNAVQLHPVQAHGLPMRVLRAMETARGSLQLVDLSKLVRRLEGELRTTQDIDIPGLVFYTLRAEFKSAPQFIAAAERNAAGTWWPVLGGYVWQAAARAVDPSVLVNPIPAQALPGPCLPASWCPA
jgi:hypothetical protein